MKRQARFLALAVLVCSCPVAAQAQSLAGSSPVIQPTPDFQNSATTYTVPESFYASQPGSTQTSSTIVTTTSTTTPAPAEKPKKNWKSKKAKAAETQTASATTTTTAPAPIQTTTPAQSLTTQQAPVVQAANPSSTSAAVNASQNTSTTAEAKQAIQEANENPPLPQVSANPPGVPPLPPKTEEAAPAAAPAAKPVAGYEGGLFIQDPNGKFRVGFNLRVQPRITSVFQEATDDAYSLYFRRIRWTASGFIITDKLTYLVQNDLVKGGLKAAEIAYSVMPELTLSVGYGGAPFGIHSQVSSGKYQFTDIPNSSAKFAFGDALGVWIAGNVGKFFYNTGAFNGPDTGATGFNTNNELAYGLLVGYSILGSYDISAEMDPNNSPEPQLGIGLEGGFHHEEAGTQGRVIHAGMFSGFKWNRWSAQAEGVARWIDPDQFTQQQLDAGYFAQVGFFVIPKKLEVAVRHSATLDDLNNVGINQRANGFGSVSGFQDPQFDFDAGGDSDNEYEFDGAMNYYIVGNNIKLQLQYTYYLDGQAGPDDISSHNVMLQGQFQF